MRKNQVSIMVLPESKNTIYEQRESGMTHTAFELEYQLFEAIRKGETEQVRRQIETYLGHGLVMGKLSNNSMKQMRYWAVATIAVAIHYAILGGLDETVAFNLSDEYIRHVDGLDSFDACILYLEEKAVELTEKVHNIEAFKTKSLLVRKCIHYINIHLHDRLMVKEIANELKVSREYLSRVFHQEMKVTLHNYILCKKVEESVTELLQGETYDTISYSYGFCSETHYIKCFQKRFGMTPGVYKKINFH